MSQHKTFLPPARSSGIRHIGFVVADLERAMHAFAQDLALYVWYLPRFANGENFLRGTQLLHTEYALASAFSGGVEVQLIQVRGGDRDVCADFLQTRGEGMHHVGVYVNDLEASVAAYRARGIGILQAGQLNSSGKTRTQSKYAYLDTTALGVTLELIELKCLGIPLRSSRALFELGALTCAITKKRIARANGKF